MGTIVKPAVRDAWGDDAMSSADMVDPGNSAVSAGWPLSTTPPSRQRFNWILNYCMNAVRYFSRRGIPDYDAAETYVANDITRGPDNILYASRVAGNIGNTPASSPTKWAPLPYVTPAQLSSAVAPLATSATVSADVTTLNAAIAAAKAAAESFATSSIATAIAALPIVKAGSFTSTAGTTVVTFATDFPTSCYGVSVDWEYVGPDVGWVVPGSRSAHGFSYYNGNGGACTYIAVGH